jgi:MFS family permease
LTTTFTVPRERARAFGVFGAIAGAGGAIGLLLGGVLTQAIDRRWSLYINVVFAVVAVVGTLGVRDDAERTGPRARLDLPRHPARLGGAVRDWCSASPGPSPTAGARCWTWGSLAAAALLLVGFVLRQLRSAQPLLPLSILLDRNRGAAYGRS